MTCIGSQDVGRDHRDLGRADRVEDMYGERPGDPSRLHPAVEELLPIYQGKPL